MDKLKNTLTSLVLIISLVLPAFMPAAVSGAGISSDDTDEACAGLTGRESGGTCGAADTAKTEVGVIIQRVINILSWIVGIASVIAILISAFKFITSAGNAQNVQSARTTLIYAVVGILVVIAAQTFVRLGYTAAGTAAN